MLFIALAIDTVSAGVVGHQACWHLEPNPNPNPNSITLTLTLTLTKAWWHLKLVLQGRTYATEGSNPRNADPR